MPLRWDPARPVAPTLGHRGHRHRGTAGHFPSATCAQSGGGCVGTASPAGSIRKHGRPTAGPGQGSRCRNFSTRVGSSLLRGTDRGRKTHL